MAVENEEEEVFDFGKKRKKKSSKKKDEEGDGPSEEVKTDFVKGSVYAYPDLLKRLYAIVEEKHAGLGDHQKYVMKPPQVVRVGSKKVAWVNFIEICGLMNREPEHVKQYVLAEFGSEGNMAGDGQLVLKGRFMNKHAESILRKYIKEYITCQMCKSANTKLKKDTSTRLQLVECNNCGATRTPATIKSGFHSVSRADRKAAKQGAQKQIKG